MHWCKGNALECAKKKERKKIGLQNKMKLGNEVSHSKILFKVVQRVFQIMENYSTRFLLLSLWEGPWAMKFHHRRMRWKVFISIHSLYASSKTAFQLLPSGNQTDIKPNLFWDKKKEKMFCEILWCFRFDSHLTSSQTEMQQTFQRLLWRKAERDWNRWSG